MLLTVVCVALPTYSLERKPWKEEDTQSKVVLSKLFTCGQLLLHIRVDNVMEFGALVPGVQVSAPNSTDSLPCLQEVSLNKFIFT